MPRPVKKPDGKGISAYISRDIYELMMKVKPPSKSISDFVEDALRHYIKNQDLVKEYDDLLQKYVELKEKCMENANKSETLYQRIASLNPSGKTWRQVMEALGITEPKEIVRILEENTTYPDGTKSMRVFRNWDEYYLVDINNAPSDIYFVFVRRKKKSPKESDQK